MYRLGKIQKKILVILSGGVALGLSSSPTHYFKTLKKISREWKNIEQDNFSRSIRRLATQKLVEEKKLVDGSYKLVLTPEGKDRARKLSFIGDSIKIKTSLANWDGKWRIVMFDIPEEDRLFRNILRSHLYDLNFYKLQHSVFVTPNSCEKAILDLVAIHSAEEYVRVITAVKIDNEDKIKRYFFKAHNHHLSAAVSKRRIGC